MVNVLSVYVTDRKIGNTLSVFLVHTGKIIYFLSGTDYFCRYFSNTQENYEKKSTRQNLPQSEHPAPSENPVQRQKEKKRPTARTWSTVRCICLASKKQVQCSPVGGGQLVPALISIDSIPAEFQMNPGRRGLQIRNSHGLCFSVAVEPQSQQMFYSGRVCLFRFQKVF